MLITYEQYTKLGGKLDETTFQLYIQLTEAEFRKISGGELPTGDTLETCCMIMLNAYEKSDNMPVESRATSFSNDGVSVSVAITETSESVIETALDRVKLLFANAGVRRRSLGVRHRE